MAKTRSTGTFLIIPLGDSTFGYGRTLAQPNIAFYRYRTDAPDSDLDRIAASPIAFTLAVLVSDANRWRALGQRELEHELQQPIVRFMQDIADFRQCTIFDNTGMVHDVSPEECVGLERSVVWNSSGVTRRLLDMFAGRPNDSVERNKVRLS